MEYGSATFRNSNISKIFFITGIVILFFWISGNVISIYKFAVIGAIYELLWLPVLAMLFIIPVLSMVFWSREKFKLRSLFLYTILVAVTTILLMIFLPL